MKDYKPEYGSYEDKLGRAIGYLIHRGIWRGRASCKHQYRNSKGGLTAPGRRFMDDPFPKASVFARMMGD